MAPRLAQLLARTFVLPWWEAGPTKVETWTCPACGRSVERRSPAWKGVWVTATPGELTALCARAHGVHDRKGRQGEDALAPVALHEDWIPVVARDDGSFVALVPPAGLAFTPVEGGFGVAVLDELKPSDLIGRPAGEWVGRRVGTIATDAVRLDDHGRPEAVDQRRLPQPAATAAGR